MLQQCLVMNLSQTREILNLNVRINIVKFASFRKIKSVMPFLLRCSATFTMGRFRPACASQHTIK
jgi:hypothetical protein